MEDKRSYLEMIQGVINRMSTNSFVLKGWVITLVAALFALAAEKSSAVFLYLAFFPTIVFWALDGYYLWQERLFRKLYDKVRLSTETSVDFSMDTAQARTDVGSFWRTIGSRTLFIFYGAVVVSICLVILFL